MFCLDTKHDELVYSRVAMVAIAMIKFLTVAVLILVSGCDAPKTSQLFPLDLQPLFPSTRAVPALKTFLSASFVTIVNALHC